MSGVNMPQGQKKDSTGQMLQIGGAIAGASYGGPQGALMGASAGQIAGGMLQRPLAETPVVGSNAMQRRLAAPQPMNPDQYAPQLAAAEQAAMQLPKDQQAMYLPAIQKARSMNSGGGYA